ncbi:hypothetical protein CDD83_7756 [Cordyceps sp. RAO-2017]|nr:hypothetical protein CDD83_7756 [Cordyceps sp. RAO-2017]
MPIARRRTKEACNGRRRDDRTLLLSTVPSYLPLRAPSRVRPPHRPQQPIRFTALAIRPITIFGSRLSPQPLPAGERIDSFTVARQREQEAKKGLAFLSRSKQAPGIRTAMSWQNLSRPLNRPPTRLCVGNTLDVSLSRRKTFKRAVPLCQDQISETVVEQKTKQNRKDQDCLCTIAFVDAPPRGLAS